MRIFVALAFAATFAVSAVVADDSYGERLCTKYIGMGAPCDCVGPLLAEEYDEDELEPLLLVMKTFMEGLTANSAASQQAAQKVIDRIEAEHGKSTVEDWMKRYDGVEKELEATCKWKW